MAPNGRVDAAGLRLLVGHRPAASEVRRTNRHRHTADDAPSYTGTRSSSRLGFSASLELSRDTSIRPRSKTQCAIIELASIISGTARNWITRPWSSPCGRTRTNCPMNCRSTTRHEMSSNEGAPDAGHGEGGRRDHVCGVAPTILLEGRV